MDEVLTDQEKEFDRVKWDKLIEKLEIDWWKRRRLI